MMPGYRAQRAPSRAARLRGGAKALRKGANSTRDFPMANRPIAPHLMDGARLHWKWGPHMAVSILHRITGQGLAFVGLPALLWWLGALASGPEAYADFLAVADSGVGMIVLVGLSWAFFTHLCSGLRHLVLDMGANYELGHNKVGSIVSMVGGVVLTAAFWAVIVLR